MLSIAVNSASIIWNVIQIASTMTNKAEFQYWKASDAAMLHIGVYLHARLHNLV